MLTGFVNDGEKHLARINDAVSDDYLQFRESLHALKGSAAEMGAVKLSAVCEKGENFKAYDIGTEEMYQLRDEIRVVYEKTVSALNEAVHGRADT